MRFYAYEDTLQPGTGRGFRALAMVRAAAAFGDDINSLGQQLSDTFYLPPGIVISNAPKLSPPLAKISSKDDREGIIKKAKSAEYRAFHFFPDGSTDLPQHDLRANECYFTVGEERIMANGSTPKNFFAVQVDPNTGRTVTYRP